jgi:hypothetical protein
MEAVMATVTAMVTETVTMSPHRFPSLSYLSVTLRTSKQK